MKSVMDHSFSEVPSIDKQRSVFDRSFGHKTTINAGPLYPLFCDEALPGDTFTVNPTIFGRINTPIYPLMDNLFLDIHFFSVPIRQIWDNFRRFSGERINPTDSTDFLVPSMNSGAGYANQTIFDYLGLPTNIPNYDHSALPLRAFNHVFNEWYRDQNMVGSVASRRGDSGDSPADFALFFRGKRHDYFTSCLPWLQKGDSVDLPLGQDAPVSGIGMTDTAWNTGPANSYETDASTTRSYAKYDTGPNVFVEEDPNNTGYPNIRADLSAATAATVNELRLAFQIQRLLERDARSGTRYSEIVKAHFGVNFLDVTYRPEFLGGTSAPVRFDSVATTNEGSRVVGDLAAAGTVVSQGGGFTKSFTEHCIVLGIVSVRADLTYQQGLDRMWSRSTRYDFYWPALAHLGEQAVLNKEIYCQDATTDSTGSGTPDNEEVFGYQERWAEYRYKKSMVTGKMRSNDAQSLDAWHLSQEFSALPTLDYTFISENPPMDRVVAVPSEPDFTLDCYFQFNAARPMPVYSVPGLIDHF